MIEIGKYNTLPYCDTKVGLFLGHLIPIQKEFTIFCCLIYVPNEFEIGEELIVFVYLDHEERGCYYIRTIYLANEFALLRKLCQSSRSFMDWGMEKIF
jgi:predicted RNA-binding protein (virulence factor B family)